MSSSKIRIIYEMANNHMGDLQHGLKIINQLKQVSKPFDFEFAVKFQFRNLDTFIHPNYKGSDLKFVKRFEETVLSEEDWKKLINETRRHNFKCITTPFDEQSIPKAINLDIDILKIASCSMSDWPLIEELAKTNKEIIFSTAGATLSDIDDMVSFFKNRDKTITLMHCVGKYPTPDNELQIGQIEFYKKRYSDINIGYSTHEDPNNFIAAGLALSMGATTFEKHVAIKTEKYGVNDYSATPDQLKNWLKSILDSYSMMGMKDQRANVPADEISSLKGLQRGMFLNKNIKKGHKIILEDLNLFIPVEDKGFTANDFSKYSEFKANKDINKNEAINKDNVTFTNLRNNILNIVEKIKTVVKENNIIIPNGQIMEISHHYGVENFYKFGLVMFTIVNEEYCKKLLILLPNQKHPAQYHKIKRETFHVIHGDVNLSLDGVESILKTGDVITIDPGVVHIFSSKNGCIIEEISSNHKANDSFYVDDKITKNSNRKTLVNYWR